MELADIPYQNFLNTLVRKSPRTKETYEDALLQFRRATFTDDLLELLDSEKEDKIIQYIGQKHYSTANKAVSALRLFYAANRVKLDWDHILLFMPKTDTHIDYRPYTKDEITAFLKKAELREQIAALMMSTGGFRIGALPTIQIEKLVFVDKYKLYCVMAYTGTSEEYLSFVTPQCSELIKKYIGKRKSGPLFITKTAAEASFPADEYALTENIRRVAKAAGIYSPREIQLDHGFRKFLRTTLETCRIHDDFAERLLNHKKDKLKKVYSHPEPLELLEASEYYKAIETLTFDL